MRFENILHIYWTKGIFVCTKLYYFDNSVLEIVKLTPGLGPKFTEAIKKRFEFNTLSFDSKHSIDSYELTSKVSVKRPLNIIFSQVLSVNNNCSYLIRLRVIYQFLAKTYKGKCHAVGKPVYGQRTWSNAWTSYTKNNTLVFYIRRIVINSTRKAHSGSARGGSKKHFILFLYCIVHDCPSVAYTLRVVSIGSPWCETSK